MDETYRILGDFGSFSVNVGLNSAILTQKCPYMGIESTIYRTNKTISVIVPIQGTLSSTCWVHDQATSETWKIFLKNPQNLPDSTRNQSEFRRGTFLNRKNTQSYATYQIFKSFERKIFPIPCLFAPKAQKGKGRVCNRRGVFYQSGFQNWYITSVAKQHVQKKERK